MPELGTYGFATVRRPMTWRGVWSAQRGYQVMDVVRSSSALWIANLPSAAATPGAGNVTGASLWGTNTAFSNTNNGGAWEVGTKFTVTRAGLITGGRFYKQGGDTGTHTLHLWDANSQALLASVAFSGESASGWQSASFATAYSVDTSHTYVISYSVPTGNWTFQSSFPVGNVVTAVGTKSWHDGGAGVNLFPSTLGGSCFGVDASFSDTPTPSAWTLLANA